MAFDPIRLGSAAGNSLIFETGSSISTSDSGIQTCKVKAVYPDGANIFNVLPPAGTTFSSVFGSSYLPASFLVDYSDGGPDIDYVEGKVARVTINFKRPDPLTSGETASRQVFQDSTINYKSMLSPVFYTRAAASGEEQDGVFGFPEPVITVKYNTPTQPGIGSGGLAGLYALPGSTKAAGFPPAPDIAVPFTFAVPAGGNVTYFNGSTFISTTVTSLTTFTYNLNFFANPRGWQLTKLKADPVAARNFFDVEENWRNFYFFRDASFVSAIPPAP